MRFPLALLLFSAIPHTLPAQSPRDTVHAVLVGKTETAQLSISFTRSVPYRDMAWGTEGMPIAPGLGEPVILESTLPILLGSKRVPAGRHEFRVVADGATRALVVVDVAVNAAGEVLRSAELVRAPVSVTALDVGIAGLDVQVRSVRHAMDTVRAASQSRPGMNRIIREVVPGTRHTLVLQVGKIVMSVPISAR
jgi:hypothetical protein